MTIATAETIAEIRARHVPVKEGFVLAGMCSGCNFTKRYPCDAAKLLESHEALRTLAVKLKQVLEEDAVCPNPTCENGAYDSGGTQSWGEPINLRCPWEGHGLLASDDVRALGVSDAG